MALAPELVGLLATFALVCALIALQFGYTYTLGALLRSLALILNVKIPLGFGRSISPFSAIGGALTALDNEIRHGIGVGISYAQYGFNKMLHVIAYSIQETGRAIEALAHDTLRFATYIRHHLIATLITIALGPLWLAIEALRKAISLLTHTVPKVAAQAASIAGDVTTAARTKVIRIERTVVKTVTVDVPKLGDLIGDVRDWTAGKLRQVTRRLGHLERLATVAGITGLVIAALSRLGLGWTRCSKVGRLGKGVCGMDENLISQLLVGSLLVVGTIDLVRAAKDLQSLVGESAHEVHRFWRV